MLVIIQNGIKMFCPYYDRNSSKLNAFECYK